jgi:hypothetical protein
MSIRPLVRLKERATTRQHETDVTQCQLNDADGRRNPTNMPIRNYSESFMLDGTINEDPRLLAAESLYGGKFVEIC